MAGAMLQSFLGQKQTIKNLEARINRPTVSIQYNNNPEEIVKFYEANTRNKVQSVEVRGVYLKAYPYFDMVIGDWLCIRTDVQDLGCVLTNEEYEDEKINRRI